MHILFGKSASVNKGKGTVKQWKEELPNSVKSYDLKDIFNARFTKLVKMTGVRISIRNSHFM